MMKSIGTILLLFVPTLVLFGQYYLDQSVLLPAPFNQRQTMDVATADLNMDGYADLVLANEFQANTILLGSADGNYVHSPQAAMNIINDSEDVIIADFNVDGWPDIIFCSEDDFVNGESNVHEYYLGSESGAFTKAAFQFPDSEANAVITVDVNNDEWPDVLFGNNGPINCMINKGDGTFENESERFPTANKTTQDLHAFDADGDGDLDIFEGNENGNILFMNDGFGQYTMAPANALPALPMETRKIASGDFDKDDDLDLFLCNVTFTTTHNKQNRLWLNDGSGNFSDITLTHLPTDNDQTLDAQFGDVDLDDDLDLIIGNVFGTASKIYLNDQGTFTEQTIEVLGNLYFLDALAVLFTDLNQDGFKDIFFADRTMGGDGSKDVLLSFDVNTNTTAPLIPVSISLVPNPADSMLHIESQPNYFDQLTIGDFQGKEIMVKKLKKAATDLAIDIAHLPAGQYSLSLYKDQQLLHSTAFVKL